MKYILLFLLLGCGSVTYRNHTECKFTTIEGYYLVDKYYLVDIIEEYPNHYRVIFLEGRNTPEGEYVLPKKHCI